jgi:hypothetical protein
LFYFLNPHILLPLQIHHEKLEGTMPNNQAQSIPQGQEDEDPSPKNKHVQSMQWAILIIIAVLTVLTLILPVVAYVLTGNVVILTPAASALPLGFVWTWIARRVFPLNQQDHERELEKLKKNKEPD